MFKLTDEIDDDEMEDDVREDEIRESAFWTDSSELFLVGRIDLKIWFWSENGGKKEQKLLLFPRTFKAI